MKQVFAGLCLLAVFVLYSLGVRHGLPDIGTLSVLQATPSNSVVSPPTSSTGDPSSSTPVVQNTGSYKDGTYTGSIADAYYGNVEVAATIAGGKITDVALLQYPNDHPDSIMINQQAMPYLKQEAIQAQSAQVQIVSGATFTSEAFQQSLAAALAQAKA